LASHIRYQGFQGNIRATTRPVSFDPQAFGLLMSLPQIESWRKNGGVMVSDNLGSPAIRRFYDLTNQPFDMPRRVALNAFLAGNDLLYIADFSSGDIDSYNSTLRTLEFFSQKYREDPAFAQRVDESVLRILTLKYRLYENFSLGLILAPATGIDNIANASETTFQVAREAATLISPTKQELDDTVPDAPNLNDRVVFITEVRSAQQCSQCPEQDLLGVDDFQQVVIRRYGPQAGGQVSPNNLSSFSLSDLELMLNTESGSSLIERDLRRANWIVFSLVKPELDQASYEILQRFLFERPDLIQQKRLFVYGFNAPYYLDATDISKLTAFYALYSKVPQFIDVAAYLLFRELQPTGSLPVSVPAVGYDLNSALFPDPNLTIPLALDLPLPETLPGTATPEPAPIPEYRVGDIIPVRAGVILDHNGHPVPDGTQVEFILSMSGQAQTINQIAITVDGVARSSFQVNDPGTLEIRAESEPAKNSDVLRFDILPINGEQISPTPIPEPTQTPTPTATIPPIVTTASGQTVPSLNQTQFGDWLIAILIIAAIGWTFYRLAALAGQIRWGIRGGFLAIIGGMLAYTYLALDFPGSEVLLEESIARGVVITSIAGCIAGIFIALLWRAVTHRTTT
jgi:beta-N-acetylhexosaminidase